MSNKIDAWQAFMDYPPVIVRLLAKRRVGKHAIRAISTEEVSIAADLPMARVQEIQSQLDWQDVSIIEAEQFCRRGCNFDPVNGADRNRAIAYFVSCRHKHPNQTFLYLRASPWWKEFSELFDLLASRPKSSTPSTLSPSLSRKISNS